MIQRRSILIAAAMLPFALGARASETALPHFTFPAIEGGVIDSADWKDKVVLVVNTASMCGFAPQFNGLQDLYDSYRDKGLIVIALPSGDFLQEKATGAEAKAYCELTFGIDLPMSDLIHVARAPLHPFYAWLKDTRGFEPSWNFNKVLIDRAGAIVDTYGSTMTPEKLAPIIAGLL